MWCQQRDLKSDSYGFLVWAMLYFPMSTSGAKASPISSATDCFSATPTQFGTDLPKGYQSMVFKNFHLIKGLSITRVDR